MIKYILFDNNGVLTTSDRESTYGNISKLLRTTEEKVASLFNAIVRDLDVGKMTQDEFYRQILINAKSSVSLEEFRKVHLRSYVPKKEVQEFAQSLKSKYKIFLVTNFGDAFWSMFNKWGLNKVFPKKDVFVSSDIKLAKPFPEIYLFALNKIGAKPKETVFIDDNAENVKSAESLGIHTILFEGLDALKDSLKKLGIKVE